MAPWKLIYALLQQLKWRRGTDCEIVCKVQQCVTRLQLARGACGLTLQVQ